MEKHKRPLDNDSLDQLLRNFLLEENTIHFTEKEMDMNAAMLFSAQSPAALPLEKEKILMRDLEALLESPNRKRGWWISSILFLVVGCSIVYFLTRSTVSPTANTGVNTSQADVVSPVAVVNNGTADEDGAAYTHPGASVTDSLFNDSVPAGDSAEKKQAPVGQSGPGTPTRMHIPLDYGYEEYPVAAKDPVFWAKPSPDNFKVVKGTFRVDTLYTGGTMFRTTQASVAENYYEGEPFKNGMYDFQYVNFGAYAVQAGGPTLLPWQVMCYADTNEVDVVQREWRGNAQGNLKLNAIPQQGVRLAMEPFYFCKYEVTNSEYRQFLRWVRTSNGYEEKQITKVTIDTIPVTDPNDRSGEQITVKGKKFRIKRTTEILEDYNKVYRYIFFNPSDKLLEELQSQTVNVYPDTNAWVSDFSFSYNEPMRDYYFWHPAYNDYPVVGISWFQAMAFLDWKTYMHQKQFDTEGVPYMIEYSLPSDIEWELVMMLHKQDEKIAYDFKNECSEGWMTNLGVTYNNDDAYDRPNYLKTLFTKDQQFRGDYIADGFFHTGAVRLPKSAKAHVGPFDICWLDGNVSEWMMESYADNWKPFFQKHLLAMDIDRRETTQLAKQIETMFDKGNAANGKLVRGSNWYDERSGSRPGSFLNEAGISPRRYIDPREQHSTVGFRYVVRVRYKNEVW